MTDRSDQGRGSGLFRGPRMRRAAMLVGAVGLVGVGTLLAYSTGGTSSSQSGSCHAQHGVCTTTASTITAPLTTTEATTVGTTAPPSSWPASYTTGPLGANNILPATTDGALLIDYAGGDGQTYAQWQTQVLQREADTGRLFDGLGIHWGGGGTYNGYPSCAFITTGQVQWIHDQGSIPVVTWSPNASMAQVASGQWDGCITSIANYLKAFPFRVMLRPFWEMDGNWMLWQAYPGQEQTWIDGWQHFVALFQAAGASNVGFWWCPTEGYRRSLATAVYPGDRYVDWVGSDSYNQASSTVQTSPLHPGWAEFWELFNYTGHGTSLLSKHDEFGPAKPYAVGETSSLYDSTDVNRKANWDRNIEASPYGKPDMPYLVAVEAYDQNLVTSEGFDWRVDNNQNYTQKAAHIDGVADPATYQGFKDWAADPAWNVGVG
jgi:hypothetical protein